MAKIKRCTKSKLKNIWSVLKHILIIFFVMEAIILIFAITDCGEQWELLKINKCDNKCCAITTLILFRVLLYFAPALMSFLIFDVKNKSNRKEKFDALLLCFNIQFFTYSLISAIYYLCGLDYILNIDIFSKADVYMFVVGLVLSILLKQNPISKMIKLDNKDIQNNECDDLNKEHNDD